MLNPLLKRKFCKSFSVPSFELKNSLGFDTNRGGGNSNIFYFHPYLGKMNPFWLYNIFQMDWNHQPVIHDTSNQIRRRFGFGWDEFPLFPPNAEECEMHGWFWPFLGPLRNVTTKNWKKNGIKKLDLCFVGGFLRILPWDSSPIFRAPCEESPLIEFQTPNISQIQEKWPGQSSPPPARRILWIKRSRLESPGWQMFIAQPWLLILVKNLLQKVPGPLKGFHV